MKIFFPLIIASFLFFSGCGFSENNSFSPSLSPEFSSITKTPAKESLFPQDVPSPETSLSPTNSPSQEIDPELQDQVTLNSIQYLLYMKEKAPKSEHYTFWVDVKKPNTKTTRIDLGDFRYIDAEKYALIGKFSDMPPEYFRPKIYGLEASGNVTITFQTDTGQKNIFFSPKMNDIRFLKRFDQYQSPDKKQIATVQEDIKKGVSFFVSIYENMKNTSFISYDFGDSADLNIEWESNDVVILTIKFKDSNLIAFSDEYKNQLRENLEKEIKDQKLSFGKNRIVVRK